MANGKLQTDRLAFSSASPRLDVSNGVYVCATDLKMDLSFIQHCISFTRYFFPSNLVLMFDKSDSFYAFTGLVSHSYDCPELKYSENN